MMQLSIAGGGLPLNVQIRESPDPGLAGPDHLQRGWRWRRRWRLPDRRLFFDIFTEVSPDQQPILVAHHRRNGHSDTGAHPGTP